MYIIVFFTYCVLSLNRHPQLYLLIVSADSNNIFGSYTSLWLNGIYYYLCGNFHQDVILNLNHSMPAGFQYTFLSHMDILKITFTKANDNQWVSPTILQIKYQLLEANMRQKAS